MKATEIAFYALKDLSTCKYDEHVEGAVMAVAHQKGVTLTPELKAETIQILDGALLRIGFFRPHPRNENTGPE